MVFHLKGDKYCFDEQLLFYIKNQENKQAHSMLENCYPAELCDSSGSTLLHYSAKYGNPTMTEYLLNIGCNVNAKDNNDFTPLILAVEENCVTTVKVLLKAGADVYSSRGSADSILKQLINSCMGVHKQNGEITDLVRQNILERFLRRVSNDLASDTQAMAKLLFESACPLHHVIRILKNSQVTRYYLQNGYPVDKREPENDCTPLHFAVSMDDLANVKVLLEHGADVNAKDNDGRNVLFYFNDSWRHSEGQVEIINILLESGVCLSLSDKHGLSPVEKLFCFGQREVVGIVLEYVDLLAKYGSQERTILHFLAKSCQIEGTEVFELLTGRYFDINATDRQGETPLRLAILSLYPERVDFLLRKGAELSAFEDLGLQDIIAKSEEAPERYLVEIIELLLLYGFDIIPKNLSTCKNILDSPGSEDKSLTKLLIAHIKLLIEQGHQLLDYFNDSLTSHPRIGQLFQEYSLQLEGMKLTSVYQSISLFDLVTASDKKLTHYVANEDLIENFEIITRNDFNIDLYYYQYVQKRIVRAIELANAQSNASFIISQITGLQLHLILSQIISYLRLSDLQSLLLVL